MSIEMGKAIIKRAIREGKKAKPLTAAQVRMAIAYLDQLYRESKERGENPTLDVLVVRRIKVPIIRMSLANELKRRADELDRKVAEKKACFAGRRRWRYLKKTHSGGEV